MAVSKKYAGLPDLDAAPEIYETPDLTDDASTVQTAGTLRTESPSPSDEGEGRRDLDSGLYRQRIDHGEARRRFEPALVDARDVNFSDKIGIERKSYRTRRRRKQRRNGDELGNSSDSDEETVAEKLARLKREAEELRMEIEAREGGERRGEEGEEEVGELSRLLDRLNPSKMSRKTFAREEEFARQLDFNKTRSRQKDDPEQPRKESQTTTNTTRTNPSPATMTTISSFADRLTALETALGLSSLPTESQSILPTLSNLSTQISLLSSTLTPPSRTSQPNSTSNLPQIDALATRIKSLTAESEKLTLSRKSALQALTDLHDARIRHSSSSAYSHFRPSSRHAAPQQNQTSRPSTADDEKHAELFLDEQSAKISALYATLPTIQNLSPLLPVVLERLRSLSVMHAGAGEVRGVMDELEGVLGENEREIGKWRGAVERCEGEVERMGEVLARNVQVVGQMVEGLEGRVEALKKP